MRPRGAPSARHTGAESNSSILACWLASATLSREAPRPCGPPGCLIPDLQPRTALLWVLSSCAQGRGWRGAPCTSPPGPPPCSSQHLGGRRPCLAVRGCVGRRRVSTWALLSGTSPVCKGVNTLLGVGRQGRPGRLCRLFTAGGFPPGWGPRPACTPLILLSFPPPKGVFSDTL